MLDEIFSKRIFKFVIMVLLTYMSCIYISESKLSKEKCVVLAVISGTLLLILDYYTPEIIVTK